MTSTAAIPRSTSIVLFDGVCNLCNRAVLFIVKYDPDGRFLFAALQSTAGQELLQGYQSQIGPQADSIILIQGNQVYTHSEAALRIARNLTGLWPLFWALIVIPPPIRDAVYGLIARNRYRWFGKRDQCMIPTQELRKRFL